MIILIPILGPPLFRWMPEDERVDIKWLPLSKLGSEAGIFGWVKLHYLTITVAALWLIALVVPGKKKIQLNLADLAIGLFLLMGLVMLIVVPHRFDSKRRIIEILSGFVLYFIAKNVFTRSGYKKAALVSFAVTVFVVAGLGIVQYGISFNEPLNKGFFMPRITAANVPWEAELGLRATSTLGNPNFLVDVLILALPIWTACLIFMKKELPLSIMAFLAVVTYTTIVLTNSWGGYVGTMLSIVVMAAVFFAKRLVPHRKSLIILLILIFASGTAMFFISKGKAAFGKPEEETAKSEEDVVVGVKARQLLRQSAKYMIWPDKEKFPDEGRWRCLTGWGLGNFYSYSNKFISVFATEKEYERLWRERPEFLLRNPGRVHDEYLSLAVELGIPGLLVFLAIFFLALFELWKGWEPGKNMINDIFIFGAIGGIFAIWGNSFINFSFRLPATLLFLFTGMGIAIQGKKWKNLEFATPSWGSAWILFAVPILAASGYAAYKNTVTIKCLLKFYEANEEYSSYDGKLAAFPSRKVIDDTQYCADRWHKNHEVYFRLTTNLLFLNRLDEADEALKKLEYIQPYHEKTLFFRGEYWRKRGEYEKAAGFYEKAIKLEARYVKAYLILTDVYLKTGDLEKAKRTIRRALRYEDEADKRLKEKNDKVKRIQVQRGLEEQLIRMRLQKGELKPEEARRRFDEIEMKYARMKVNVLPEDILFYWLHISRAIIHAIEKETKQSDKEFEIAQNTHRDFKNVGTQAYSFHASIDIITLNRNIANELQHQEQPKDITEWTGLFYGPSDWNKYDTLQLMYRNAQIGAKTALRSSSPEKFNKADRKVEEALRYLEEMEELNFPPQFGNVKRIKFIFTTEIEAMRAAELRDFDRAIAKYKEIVSRYHYADAYAALVELNIGLQDKDEALKYLQKGIEMFPRNRRLLNLARFLGIEIRMVPPRGPQVPRSP